MEQWEIFHISPYVHTTYIRFIIPSDFLIKYFQSSPDAFEKYFFLEVDEIKFILM